MKLREEARRTATRKDDEAQRSEEKGARDRALMIEAVSFQKGA
ncbi:hypothetical protein [Vibrio brasiliensis]|nr:hypothetical protein [Vibrio brasiliensis]